LTTTSYPGHPVYVHAAAASLGVTDPAARRLAAELPTVKQISHLVQQGLATPNPDTVRVVREYVAALYIAAEAGERMLALINPKAARPAKERRAR
jgi:hypothetical protein